MQIPNHLIDAAHLDGMSKMDTAWRMAFPPGLATVVVLSIFWVTVDWNDLFWPLITTSEPYLATRPGEILYFQYEESGHNISHFMAGATLITALFGDWVFAGVEALNEAIANHGPPAIMNTEQDRQFTGSAWLTRLTEAGPRTSMVGRGLYLKVLIERLWQSLKQEAIYLEEINDGSKARRAIKDWVTIYSTKRLQTALDQLTQDDAFGTGLEEQKVA